jgi:hypothetical protein
MVVDWLFSTNSINFSVDIAVRDCVTTNLLKKHQAPGWFLHLDPIIV